MYLLVGLIIFYIGMSRLCAPKGPISGAVQESDVRLTPELPVTASVMASVNAVCAVCWIWPKTLIHNCVFHSAYAASVLLKKKKKKHSRLTLKNKNIFHMSHDLKEGKQD